MQTTTLLPSNDFLRYNFVTTCCVFHSERANSKTRLTPRCSSLGLAELAGHVQKHNEKYNAMLAEQLAAQDKLTEEKRNALNVLREELRAQAEQGEAQRVATSPPRFFLLQMLDLFLTPSTLHPMQFAIIELGKLRAELGAQHTERLESLRRDMTKQMEEQREDLIAKLNKAVADVEAARDQVKSLQEELKRSGRLTATAEKEIERLKRQLDELKADMEATGQSAGQEVSALRGKNSALEEKLRSVEDQVAQLEADMMEQQAETSTTRAKLIEEVRRSESRERARVVTICSGSRVCAMREVRI